MKNTIRQMISVSPIRKIIYRNEDRLPTTASYGYQCVAIVM